MAGRRTFRYTGLQKRVHLTRELLGVLVEEPVAEAGVEQDERKRPLALVGEGEEAP
jgi:hypothetical protein